MRHFTTSADRAAHHTVVGAFWILAPFWVVAGIVATIGVGSGLTRLAVVLAIVITEWWILSEAEDRLEKRRGDYSRDSSSRRTEQWGDKAAERSN